MFRTKPEKDLVRYICMFMHDRPNDCTIAKHRNNFKVKLNVTAGNLISIYKVEYEWYIEYPTNMTFNFISNRYLTHSAKQLAARQAIDVFPEPLVCEGVEYFDKPDKNEVEQTKLQLAIEHMNELKVKLKLVKEFDDRNTVGSLRGVLPYISLEDLKQWEY